MKNFILGILLIALIASSGCLPNSNTQPRVFPTGRVFFFKPESASHLTISRFQNGKTWTAEFQRSPSALWNITTAPGGGPLLDTAAHSNFLEHLMDTVSTLSIISGASKGTDEQLGLARPQWMFRITLQDHQTIEIIVGDQDTQTHSRITKLSLGDKSEAVLTQGAFFGLLDHVKNFNSLRLSKLSQLQADDLFEIKLLKEKKLTHSIKREVSEWIAPLHRDVTEKVDAWLERLVHLQIADYIDDPKAQKEIEKKSKSGLSLQIIVTKLDKTQEKWTFWKIQQNIYAQSDVRGSLFFKMYDDAWNGLEKPF